MLSLDSLIQPPQDYSRKNMATIARHLALDKKFNLSQFKFQMKVMEEYNSVSKIHNRIRKPVYERFLETLYNQLRFINSLGLQGYQSYKVGEYESYLGTVTAQNQEFYGNHGMALNLIGADADAYKYKKIPVIQTGDIGNQVGGYEARDTAPAMINETNYVTEPFRSKHAITLDIIPNSSLDNIFPRKDGVLGVTIADMDKHGEQNILDLGFLPINPMKAGMLIPLFNTLNYSIIYDNDYTDEGRAGLYNNQGATRYTDYVVHPDNNAGNTYIRQYTKFVDQLQFHLLDKLRQFEKEYTTEVNVETINKLTFIDNQQVRDQVRDQA